MAVILFIGAMQEETEPLIRTLGARENGFGDYEALCGEHTAAVCLCGVGKVNAAAVTQKALMRYRPDYVLNVGIAGALCKDYPLCTVVLCETARYHDFEPDWILDKYPPKTSVFHADRRLLALAEKAAVESPRANSLTLGGIVTGDRIISDADVCRRLYEQYGAQCVDMESAAIAHVCLLEKIPFLAVRCLSDFADEEALPEMDRQVVRASEAIAEISGNLLKQL